MSVIAVWSRVAGLLFNFRFPVRFRFSLRKSVYRAHDTHTVTDTDAHTQSQTRRQTHTRTQTHIHTQTLSVMTSMCAARAARGFSRLFVLEGEARAEPLCFGLSAEPRSLEHAECLSGARLFSLLVHGGGRVKSARRHAELARTLHSQLPPTCRVSPLTSFQPGVRDSVVRGFFLRDESAASSTEQLLRGLKQTLGVSVFSYEREEGSSGQYRCQELWSSDSEAGSPRLYLTHATPPQEHPAVLSIINSDVFYRMEDAHQVLQEVWGIILVWHGGFIF